MFHLLIFLISILVHYLKYLFDHNILLLKHITQFIIAIILHFFILKANNFNNYCIICFIYLNRYINYA